MAGGLKTIGVQFIPISLALLVLPSCDFFGEPVAKGAAIDGQVLDARSDKPISGAIVVATWSGIVGSLAHSQGVCFHVESTTSDAEGRYHIRAWQKTTRFARTKHQVVATIAHKPRYSFDQKSAGNALYMEPFTGTRQERLQYLMRVLDSTRCGAQDESERNLHPLYKSLYEEGTDIAVSQEDKELVDTLRYWSSFVLFDPSKPTARDEKGRLINVEPGERSK